MGSPSQQSVRQGGKILVVASFYPLYDFGRKVGGDRVEVVNMIPAGVEPHEWEPRPRDLEVLESADIFVYNGAGLDSWATKAVKSIKNKKLIAVNSSEGLMLEYGREGFPDPHVWLDPLMAKTQTKNILNALVKKDPDNELYYTKNYDDFSRQLDDLDLEIAKNLKSCRHREIIVSHAAFNYFAERYNITQIPLRGVDPGAEPNVGEISAIVEMAKAENVKYVFYEELLSPKPSEVIAAEIGGGVLALNPLHGLTEEETSNGKDYLSVMRENLNNLKTAMECE